jgi:polyisoprenyl-teichoic acid--peptidoglycan teichoic acid transferase
MIPSMQTSSAPERQASAFAAAFLSALLPGLGQAYLGRWARALAWVAPTILGLALVVGIWRSMGSKDFGAQFADPAWQLTAMAIIAIHLVYSLLSALDAFRIARAGSVTSNAPALRLGSLGGLAAVLLVFVFAHVAFAAPFYSAYGVVQAITNPDDNQPLPSNDTSLLPPTAAPTATPLPGETPGPTATPAPTPTQGPAWDGTSRLNILLVGDNGAPRAPTFNTDTMIVVSIDPVTKQVGLISLPRDTQNVPLPPNWAAYRAYGGVYPSKINTLWLAAKSAPSLFPGTSDQQRGFNALMGTLGNLYNLDINYYVQVNLSSFRTAIDALWGTMIDVQIPVNDPFYPPSDGRGYLKLYIAPGYNYFNGAEALAYARSRHGAGDDYIRAARQERTITSIRQQVDLSTLLSPGVLDNLLATLSSSVHTNIPASLFPKLIGLAQTIDLNKRVSIVLSPPTYGSVCYPCPPSGLWAIKPNIPAIRQAVANIFKQSPAQAKQRAQLEAENATVNVLNGTTGTNVLANNTVDYLSAIGINALMPPVNGGAADRSDYTDTVIIAYNGADQSMPTTLSVLQKTFGVTAQTAADSKQQADFVVIVGSATPTLKPPN